MDTVSRNMVLNKSIDLVTKKESGEFMKYRKASKEIKELRVQWNKKMEKLQEDGYGTQEIKNPHQEQVKLKDLEYLKSATPQGPFTQKQEVLDFMESLLNDEEKCQRLYVEVRYARMTSQTLPITASVFRLRVNGKYLKPVEYATYLAQYLGNSQSVSTVSIADLPEVLVQVKEKTVSKASPTETDTNIPGTQSQKGKNKPEKNTSLDKELAKEIKEGDHLIVFWDEGSD